jgi:hypothetical protein
MDAHVVAEGAVAAEASAALHADVGSFAGVTPHVAHETHFLPKLPEADVAGVGHLAAVDGFVQVETRVLPKALAAVVALEGWLFCVFPLVDFELVLRVERLVAHLALVVPVADVPLQMLVQVLNLGKLLSAELASAQFAHAGLVLITFTAVRQWLISWAETKLSPINKNIQWHLDLVLKSVNANTTKWILSNLFTFLGFQVFPASWICLLHLSWVATRKLRRDCCPFPPKAAGWGWGLLRRSRRLHTWKCHRCQSDPPPEKAQRVSILHFRDTGSHNTLRRMSSSSSSDPIELLQLESACCRETGEEPAISAARPITAISFEFILTAENLETLNMQQYTNWGAIQRNDFIWIFYKEFNFAGYGLNIVFLFPYSHVKLLSFFNLNFVFL